KGAGAYHAHLVQRAVRPGFSHYFHLLQGQVQLQGNIQYHFFSAVYDNMSYYGWLISGMRYGNLPAADRDMSDAEQPVAVADYGIPCSVQHYGSAGQRLLQYLIGYAAPDGLGILRIGTKVSEQQGQEGDQQA